MLFLGGSGKRRSLTSDPFLLHSQTKWKMFWQILFAQTDFTSYGNFETKFFKLFATVSTMYRIRLFGDLPKSIYFLLFFEHRFTTTLFPPPYTVNRARETVN